MTSYVYGIFHNNPDPICIYVGQTTRTLEARFDEHKKGILDPKNKKELYVYCRANNLLDTLYIEQFTEAADGQPIPAYWESDFVKELVELGMPLQNTIHGSKKTTARKLYDGEKPFKSDRRNYPPVPIAMDIVDGKLVPCADFDTRRENGLSKAESFRQQILNIVPTLEEMINLPWCERETNKRWVSQWGKYFIRLKKIKGGYDIEILNEQTREFLGTTADCKNREFAFQWCIDNWSNPKSWIRRVNI